MATPIVIETLRDPNEYSQGQIDEMCLIYSMLNRGLLQVMIEPDTSDLLREDAE